MPDFSHLIPESHQNVSPGLLGRLIETQREELFTGLMRLSHLTGEHYLFSFLEGTQQKLYRCLDGLVDVVPRQTWAEAYERGNSLVGFLRLPFEAIRFTKVLHEVPVQRVEESTFSSEQMAGFVEKWSVENQPGIVHLQSEDVNRYYLIAGDSTPVIEALSIAGGEVRFSLNDASFPNALPKQNYHVRRYISVHEHDAWREYELRLAFHPFMRMLLQRFGELTGRALTDRLCQQLSAWAREGGWNISVSSNGIVNRQYFDSLENAVELYLDLMRRFQAEASFALGPGMTNSIAQEVLMKLDPYRRELLRDNISSWFSASTGTGITWR